MVIQVSFRRVQSIRIVARMREVGGGGNSCYKCVGSRGTMRANVRVVVEAGVVEAGEEEAALEVVVVVVGILVVVVMVVGCLVPGAGRGVRRRRRRRGSVGSVGSRGIRSGLVHS
jgi:hypothetical protein